MVSFWVRTGGVGAVFQINLYRDTERVNKEDWIQKYKTSIHSWPLMSAVLLSGIQLTKRAQFPLTNRTLRR